VLPVADAAILSKLADGALVVANVRMLRRPQLQEALANLAQVGARVLGVALNRVQRDTDAYSYQTVAPEAQPPVARPVVESGTESVPLRPVVASRGQAAAR
jgi:Mrp family chromosome partitioning ATPase